MANPQNLNFPWVIRLRREDAGAMASLRLLPGMEVADDQQDVWLRGPAGDKFLPAQLAALPARERYERLASNQLRRVDHRVPDGPMPDLVWQPLKDWISIQLPPVGTPATLPAPIPLRLIRSTQERESVLLLTQFTDLKRFAWDTGAVRLERLRFAAADDGQVLIQGTPLPPLPGHQFTFVQGVALPAGFTWDPPVEPEVLSRLFRVAGDAVVLWHADGTISRLHREQFVPVTRGAIVATERALREFQDGA